VVSVNFRDKRSGWKDFGVALQLKSGREILTPFEHDWFMRGFLQNIALRPSCYRCQFNRVPRVGDITLGDFWGIGEVDAQLDDGNGCSLVLVNGEKGGRLFDGVRARLVTREHRFDDALRRNPHVVSSAETHPRTAQFYRDLESSPFEHVVKNYLGERSSFRRLRSAIRRTLGRRLGDIVRSAVGDR
jgi:hypothetical protein